MKTKRIKYLFLTFALICILVILFTINVWRIFISSSTLNRLNIDYNMVTGPEWYIRNPNTELIKYFETKNYREFYVYLSGNVPSTYDKKNYRILTNFILYGNFLDSTIGQNELNAPLFEVNKYEHLPFFPILDRIIER
jgi:ABC-type sugar transport system permease subunit